MAFFLDRSATVAWLLLDKRDEAVEALGDRLLVTNAVLPQAQRATRLRGAPQ